MKQHPCRARRIAGAAVVLCVFLLLVSPPAPSLPHPRITLDAIDYVLLPGNRIEIRLQFSEPVPEPSRFVIFEPARIALDLPGGRVNLSQRHVQIGVGMAVSVAAVQAGEMTRVVVNLVRMAPHRIRVEDRLIRLIIEQRVHDSGAGSGGATYGQRPPLIGGIDFVARGAAEGRVLVELPQPAPGVQIFQRGDHIVVEIRGAVVPQRLERLLDVGDFATPVRTIEAFSVDHRTSIVIAAGGRFEQTTYRTNSLLIIAVNPAR